MKKRLMILFCILMMSETCYTQDVKKPLEITFIGNEGFVISSAGKKVMIDGLLKKRDKGYYILSGEQHKKITRAVSPYENINLLLVTHYHGDHFDAKTAVNHLINNPKGILTAPKQAVDRMREIKDYSKISEQVMEVTPGFGETEEQTVNGISLKVLGLRHCPYYDEGVNRHSEVKNNAYIFTVGGNTIFHVGDATMEVNEDLVKSFNLDKEGIDVTFVEYFDFNEITNNIINNVIRPKKVIPMHISPRDMEKISERFSRAGPALFLFKEPMERKVFEF